MLGSELNTVCSVIVSKLWLNNCDEFKDPNIKFVNNLRKERKLFDRKNKEKNQKEIQKIKKKFKK